jgi:hypothetical protein
MVPGLRSRIYNSTAYSTPPYKPLPCPVPPLPKHRDQGAQLLDMGGPLGQRRRLDAQGVQRGYPLAYSPAHPAPCGELSKLPRTAEIKRSNLIRYKFLPLDIDNTTIRYFAQTYTA